MKNNKVESHSVTPAILPTHANDFDIKCLIEADSDSNDSNRFLGYEHQKLLMFNWQAQTTFCARVYVCMCFIELIFIT